MKPLIGVTVSLTNAVLHTSIEHAYALEVVGALPVAIPYLQQKDTLVSLLERLDGIVLTGGGDIDPFLFGEEPRPELGEISPERDRLETICIQYALAEGKPILGICRGAQILNVIAGGGMIQDIYSQLPGDLLQHTQQAPRDHLSHEVHVEDGSMLHRIIGKNKIRVNSFHHQAINTLAPGFVLSATATDGVIEAFESYTHPFAIGVQWHPEDLFSKEVEAQQLFAAFVSVCKNQKI